MRILILNDRLPPEGRGGAETVSWRLAVALQQAGHELHVITTTPGASFDERREDVPTYHLHAGYPERWRAYLALYNPQTVGALKRLYRRLQPDVVNAHNIHYLLSYHALTLAHRLGIPTVFSAHDVMPFAYAKLKPFIDPSPSAAPAPDAYRLPPGYNRRQARLRYNPGRNRRVRHVLTHHADVRTAPSHALKTALEANDLPPFDVVHNGYDPAGLAASDETRAALRARFALKGRRVILVAGRLTGGKGLFQVLAALEKVVEAVPEAVLLVLSSQPIAQAARQRHAALLADHVRLGGWLSGEELAAAFHLADVVTVPSVYLDPFPTVNLEAMAVAKPVVTTRYGGSPEAVADGETGFVVDPYDVVNYAGRITQLLRDPTLARRMGEAGLRRLNERFSLTRQVAAMLTQYERARLKR